jgi:hypothetical protein
MSQKKQIIEFKFCFCNNILLAYHTLALLAHLTAGVQGGTPAVGIIAGVPSGTPAVA